MHLRSLSIVDFQNTLETEVRKLWRGKPRRSPEGGQQPVRLLCGDVCVWPVSGLSSGHGSSRAG